MIWLLTAQSWRIKSGVEQGEEYQNIGQYNTKDPLVEDTSKCGGTIPAAKIIIILTWLPWFRYMWTTWAKKNKCLILCTDAVYDH